jgi:hypothetical protein
MIAKPISDIATAVAAETPLVILSNIYSPMSFYKK